MGKKDLMLKLWINNKFICFFFINICMLLCKYCNRVYYVKFYMFFLLISIFVFKFDFKCFVNNFEIKWLLYEL